MALQDGHRAVRKRLHGGQSPLGMALAFGAAVAFLAFSVGAEDFLHARISFAGANVMVKGTSDADWSYATVNTLVLPGDALWVDKEGTLELEMSGGTFLRMADGSKADVAALPPSALIRGWTGAFYVERVSRSTGDMVFETPVGKVRIDRDSQVRLDVLSNGATTVSVRWGNAVVQCEGANDVQVGRGERSYVDPGYLPSEPVAFDRSAEDSFDSWNRERARLLALGSDSIPREVPIKSAPMGVEDLAPYGEWVNVDSAYYWHPTVVDFVPYRSGHWSFLSTCGYVWVADYPFGYVTTHYGRWRHHDHYGWLWGYQDTWGPAWVASVRYGSNFVWAPLDPWDRPVVFGGEFFEVGGIRFGVFGSTYCGADALLAGPCLVYPCTPLIVRNVPFHEINVWNININMRDHRSRVPYRGTNIQVRDYAPRRVIRGLDVIGKGREFARARVAGLEGSLQVREFRKASVSEMRKVRTPVDAATRVAKPRSVRVQDSALKSVRDMSNRMATSSGREAVGPRSIRRAEGVSGPSRKSSVTSESAVRSETAVPRPMRSRAPETRLPEAASRESAKTPDVRTRTRVPEETKSRVPETSVRRPVRTRVPEEVTKSPAIRSDRRHDAAPLAPPVRRRVESPEPSRERPIAQVPRASRMPEPRIAAPSVTQRAPEVRPPAPMRVPERSMRIERGASPPVKTESAPRVAAPSRSSAVPHMAPGSGGRSQAVESGGSSRRGGDISRRVR